MRTSLRREAGLVARAARELRTPLNNILVLSELLADDRRGRLTPRQAEFARLIRSSCTDVLALVDELLELARLESGAASPSRSAVALEHVRESVERAFRRAAESKGLAFSVEIDPGLPAGMPADERSLRRILNNLLSNAVKFTERGSVRLRVAPARHGRMIAFAVEDTGAGIPKEKQRLAGAGLGLSISRDLAEILGGRLLLESEPGRGSTFTLLLPARPRRRRTPA